VWMEDWKRLLKGHW